MANDDYQQASDRITDWMAWAEKLNEKDPDTEVVSAEDVTPRALRYLDVYDKSPAQITIVPTATTNPKRPRTVAAGYSSKRQTLTVVFRPPRMGAVGVLYNYYEVDGLEWGNFKRARSKGRFIKAYLDDHPRGYPAENDPWAQTMAELASEFNLSHPDRDGLQLGQSAKRRALPSYDSYENQLDRAIQQYKDRRGWS